MPEGLGFVPEGVTESRQRAPEATSVERLIAERWDRLNADNEAFREREEDDTLDPTHFLDETMQEFERRFEESDHVDTMSPFERVNFLLAQLVEKGGEWSPAKRAAVRRAIFGFASQSVGAMTLPQQGILHRTILADSKTGEMIGRPKSEEQELITKWMQDTVGRGVR